MLPLCVDVYRSSEWAVGAAGRSRGGDAEEVENWMLIGRQGVVPRIKRKIPSELRVTPLLSLAFYFSLGLEMHGRINVWWHINAISRDLQADCYIACCLPADSFLLLVPPFGHWLELRSPGLYIHTYVHWGIEPPSSNFYLLVTLW
jgi:hypothetical protein